MLLESNLHALPTVASSAGVLQKWYDHQHHRFVKSSSVTPAGEHVEAVIECIASEVGATLGLPIVRYQLESLQRINGEIVTVCVSADYRKQLAATDTISALTLLLAGRLDSIQRSVRYPFLIRRFPHLRVALDQMILFDFLIDNFDRHMRNIEFYYESWPLLGNYESAN